MGYQSLAIQGNGLFVSGIGTFLTFVGGLETAKSRDRKSHSRLKYKQLASIYYVTFAVTMNTFNRCCHTLFTPKLALPYR